MTKKEKQAENVKKEAEHFHKMYTDGYNAGYNDGYKKAISDMKKHLENVEIDIHLFEKKRS